MLKAHFSAVMRVAQFLSPALVFIQCLTPAAGQVEVDPGDFYAEALPDDVLATIEARDQSFGLAADPGILGDSFFVVDFQRWSTSEPVTVAFLGGDEVLYKKIEATCAQIEDACAIDFEFRDTAGAFRTWTTSDSTHAADIRVSFDQAGNFSLVGRDSITESIGMPTGPVGGRAFQRSLNLGNFHLALPAHWERTVRHEFLHAIAFRHEHQNPLGQCDSQFRWDDDPGYDRTQVLTPRGLQFVTDGMGRRPGIYTYMSGAPNFWNKAKVDHNMRQASPASGGTAIGFDQESIMLYRFPSLFYKSVPSTCAPTTDSDDLSAGDRDGLQHLYPDDPGESSLLADRQSRLFEGIRRSNGFDESILNAIE